MKITILAAMDKEMELLKHLLENRKEETFDGFRVFTGTIGRHEVVLCKCGIGKVNAAITTYAVIRAFEPELVVNSGVAGGAGNGVRIGQLLIADYVAYHDVWCGPGTEVGVADGYDLYLPADTRVVEAAQRLLPADEVVVGLICSGDRFISEPEEIKLIRSNFPTVKAVDMESAAIAHVCAREKVPFNILRVVSDTPGEGENISQYENFFKEAPEKTFKALNAIFEAI